MRRPVGAEMVLGEAGNRISLSDLGYIPAVHRTLAQPPGLTPGGVLGVIERGLPCARQAPCLLSELLPPDLSFLKRRNYFQW